MKKLARYLLNLLILLDEAVNTVLLLGSPHETISSRLGKLQDRGNPVACKLCAWLDKIFGKDHCKRSEVPSYGEDLLL